MIKWLKRKLILSLVEDVKKQLPELKLKIEELLEEKKDLLINEVRKVVKEKIRELAEKI